MLVIGFLNKLEKVFMKITTPISVGDFIDRLSILEIKAQKGLKVDLELEEYKKSLHLFEKLGFESFKSILLQINEKLWDLEDIKRTQSTRYTIEYSNISTLITQLNDLRYQVKKKADVYFESEISELKSHK